jgi:hypothetical protein
MCVCNRKFATFFLKVAWENCLKKRVWIIEAMPWICCTLSLLLLYPHTWCVLGEKRNPTNSTSRNGACDRRFCEREQSSLSIVNIFSKKMYIGSNLVINYSLVSKYLSSLTFFHNFDHSSYSKNYAIIIYFACYMLYYCKYFKLNLSFYTFAIIFWIRRMVKVEKKINSDKYFDTEGVRNMPLYY